MLKKIVAIALLTSYVVVNAITDYSAVAASAILVNNTNRKFWLIFKKDGYPQTMREMYEPQRTAAWPDDFDTLIINEFIPPHDASGYVWLQDRAQYIHTAALTGPATYAINESAIPNGIEFTRDGQLVEPAITNFAAPLAMISFSSEE